MTIEEAVKFFDDYPLLYDKLKILGRGRPGTIWSWASRRRLCPAARLSASSSPSELGKRDTHRTIYLLDEPTTGLHFDDVCKTSAGLGQVGHARQYGGRY